MSEFKGGSSVSYAVELKCSKCGKAYPKEYILECGRCGGLLEIAYDIKGLSGLSKFQLSGEGIWRYAAFLPIDDPANFVSLGEGRTPLLECSHLARTFEVERLLIKFDGTNPTGTVKDRSSATAVAAALQFGFGAAAVVSTGNAGSSVASYSSRAGISSFIFCYEKSAMPKMNHMDACATDMIIYRGGYDNMIRIYDRIVEELPIFDCSATRNPYKQEGKKTIAYEIAEQVEGSMPDYLVCPVAVGETFIASWRGLKEWLDIGWIDKMPRMVCAQAKRANPIVRAFAEGGKIIKQDIGYTVAEGMAVGDPERKGDRVLEILRSESGVAADASDEEILKMQRTLAQSEGIWAGPTGCVSLAVLKNLLDEGTIPKDSTVACIVSETGLKSEPVNIETEPVEAEYETIKDILVERLN